MATQKLTEYEIKRLENIRRNDEMLAALQLHAKASLLSNASKRQRDGSAKSYKVSPAKKPKETETPTVIRRSLRTRGMPPDSNCLDADSNENSDKTTLNQASISREKPSPCVLGPLKMRDAYDGTGSDRAFIDTLLSFERKLKSGVGVKEKFDSLKVKEEGNDRVLCGPVTRKVKSDNLNCGIKIEKREFEGRVDLESMSLEPENIARIMPGRIMTVRFLPQSNVNIVAAGNKLGNVAFWNVDSKGEKDNGIFLYRPHAGPISGILFQQSCLSKIFTSCYDGYLRLMDAEKEVFNLVHSCDDAIFCLSQHPNDVKSLYFGEGRGGLSVWDDRTGSVSSQWTLHEDRINTIDFNPQNPNIMATSSSDATVCLWDLRKVDAGKPKSLKIVNHERAVHSAYFSPSGSSLASTSFDDTIGILSGVNFEDTSRVQHSNQTGRWISSFRATWGWDDSFVYVGNMKRGVDIISPDQRRVIKTLQSPHMTAIPCRFHAHPCRVGMLAGATAGGQVYIWTSS
ncbi:WD REPEAT-CONTAINING PROTEIN 76 [Salix purpurea]|uniref:WD repeat-containing protein 76 n=1 Tax=Salix purpurea TaxID=77065 RepID=A0A9Q0UKX3_SALPP|nr:WD REPEAT-CONTAINING PROTEIN 76 [Salix purpurea]